MALMTILFTGLDASPWMCTVSAAGAVLGRRCRRLGRAATGARQHRHRSKHCEA